MVTIEEFNKRIKTFVRQIDDLSIPMKLIAQSWYKSNRAIFTLKGPGKYADLSPKYKAYKERTLGFAYPILRGATGDLESSVTDPTNINSFNAILNKRILLLGTQVSYAGFLNDGTKKMAARPFMTIGLEQTGDNKRVDAWVEIVKTFVDQKTKGLFK